MTEPIRPSESTPPNELPPQPGPPAATSPRRIGGREHARQYADAMPVTEAARFVDGHGNPQPDARDAAGYEPDEPAGQSKPNGSQPDQEWGWLGASAGGASGPPVTFPEPEDRGLAVLSDLGETEYVDDLIRPGRIVVVAAEEGAGKSYAIDSELGIRVAVAGGSFAGTWEISQTGPVCYLSEMHPDDDYERETTVLGSLGTGREALTGKYYRLPLMTAAGGQPCLTVKEWCAWFTDWAHKHGALLAIFDTATGATQVDPWGGAIQTVFASLRGMLEAYPALAIVLW